MNHLEKRAFYDLFYNIREESRIAFALAGSKSTLAMFAIGKLIGSARRKARDGWLATSKITDHKQANNDAKEFQFIDAQLHLIAKAVEANIKGEWTGAESLALFEVKLDSLFDLVRN